MKGLYFGVVFFISWIPTLSLFAQDVKWYVESPNEINEGANFEVSFVLTNAQGDNPRFPKFSDFEILQGPSVANSMSIINGSKSSSVKYTFLLSPLKMGTMKIDPATINVNKKTLTTNTIHINVVKSRNIPGQTSKGIKAIAEAIAKPTTAYLGQQINVNYLLHYGENINMSDGISYPAYHGFFVKPIEMSSKESGSIKVGNENYQTLMLGSVALFPQKTGMLKINKATFPLKKRKPGSDPFFDPFGAYENAPISTNAIDIIVKPLPPNAPLEFSGAVGDYSMEATLNTTQLATKESALLQIKIRGDGDTKLVQNPKLNLGAGIEVFEGKTSNETEEIESYKVIHYRTVDYPITFTKAGNYNVIPKFTFFNPNTNQYEVISATPISVTIKENKADSKLNLFSEKNKNNGNQQGSNHWVWLFTLIGLGLLSLTTYFLLRNKKPSPIEQPQKIEEQRRLNAGKVALAKLSKAKSFMATHQNNEFYKEVGNAINDYIQSKFIISNEDLTKDNVSQLLSQKYSSLEKDQYLNLIEKAELAIYGGYADVNTQPIYEGAKNLIEKIELAR